MGIAFMLVSRMRSYLLFMRQTHLPGRDKLCVAVLKVKVSSSLY